MIPEKMSNCEHNFKSCFLHWSNLVRVINDSMKNFIVIEDEKNLEAISKLMKNFQVEK